MQDVLGLILGGGQGSRLFPLTRDRSKPAVPLAGKYRLIDIPMSNCIHAGIAKIAILTQFNSVSLHRHIYTTYNRDIFTPGWVQILAAEQTMQSKDWYQGTADAVRKQILEIKSAGTKYVLILSGDHLYRMDYRQYVEFHVDSGADITIAVQPVNRSDAPGLGILKLDATGQIVRFTEKPKTDDLLDEMVSGNDPDKPYMASMGIYVFATDVLLELLELEGDDFGKDIIPASIETRRVMGYVFDGYWEDIGTIRRFFDVNLDMTRPDGHFDFYSPNATIYTSARFLPASEVYGGQLHNVMLTDGCRVLDAKIRDAVIGLRCMIGEQVQIQSAILMGADYFETEVEKAENARLGRPDIGIGDGSIIEQAIIDKNARIGNHVVIRGSDERPDEAGQNWFVRDGIVIIPKNAIIPDGTVV
ncbi:MAG: glucose-1-phosphate adenylyltransferase [Ardenticatenaceae bacterium]|nr:glucose-1-phosphate adenylyltransferase [Ardenticatenaceae bacterium]MCB9445278.1 glucose-1-phosphate adenylyltransferase [Ardenticatenaceae bacterium]